MKRSSGVIMHISSLPGEYGIGTLGKEAYEYADFLKKSGLGYWQILPLGHTSYGDSPYQCFSAFAGNPYFIDFDLLKEEGLLKAEDYKMCISEQEEAVDYSRLFNTRFWILRIAYENSKGRLDDELLRFRKEKALWIEDYALYMAVKTKHKLLSWQEWEEGIRLRTKEAVKAYTTLLEDEINYWIFIQYMFFKQWNKLKKYVNDLGIKIIGDLPIYVAADSSDAWANPELFKLDEDRKPIVVAGCPPDAFSKTGQLWGNPVYDWEYLKATNYRWWTHRISESLKLYDVVRLDHFRGFESYWEVPFGDKDASLGRWVKGAGSELFRQIEKELGELNIIAEDLGYLTKEVKELKKETGFPGMKVLQFAFSVYEESDYLPHKHTHDCVVYTGTHDNDTIMGWIQNTGDRGEVMHAINYLNLSKEEGYNWGFIRGAWSSVADLAITQMQDFLGLGNEARMNMPSTTKGNWVWRMKKNALTDELASKIYNLTKLYWRLNE